MFLFLYLVLETLNYIYSYYLYNKYDKKVNNKCKIELLDKIYNELKMLSKPEIEYIYRNSILYNKTGKEFNLNGITYIEIENFIIQTIYSQNEKNAENMEIINKTIQLFEDKLEIKFKKEEENKYIYNRWGKNPILFIPKLFIIQIIIKIIINFYHYYMIYYKKYSYSKKSHNISFLYKREKEKESILFIAGLGIGFPPYMKMLEMLNEYNVIILNAPLIHGYYWGEVPNKEEIINEVKKFLEELKIQKINILSHSFGSYVSDSLQEEDTLKNIINKVIKIDPIIFWINCFQLTNYFIGNYFDYSSIKSYIFDIFVHYLLHYDLHIQNICYRKMREEDFIIDMKNLENKKNFYVLSERDYLISDTFFKKYKNNTNMYIVKDATHGEIILNNKYEKIMEKILLFFKTHETKMVF